MDKTEAIAAVLDILRISYQGDTLLCRALEDLYECGVQDGYDAGADAERARQQFYYLT